MHLLPGGSAIKSHRGQLCRPLGSALTLSNDDHSDDVDSMIDNDDDENNVDHCEDDDERGREHTCKKRVMLRRRLFWPKKICGKSA